MSDGRKGETTDVGCAHLSTLRRFLLLIPFCRSTNVVPLLFLSRRRLESLPLWTPAQLPQSESMKLVGQEWARRDGSDWGTPRAVRNGIRPKKTQTNDKTSKEGKLSYQTDLNVCSLLIMYTKPTNKQSPHIDRNMHTYPHRHQHTPTHEHYDDDDDNDNNDTLLNCMLGLQTPVIIAIVTVVIFV